MYPHLSTYQYLIIFFFIFRNFAISPANQLLGTLRFYATGCTYLEAGDFGGYGRSSAHRIIRRVSEALASLAPIHITFPETDEEIRYTQRVFWELAKFPRVLGAMDCTHVRVASPGGETPEVFRNRKGYMSLNVQGICNADLEITDIVARWPGSAHDSHIFNNSRRRCLFETGHYEDAVLVVDSGYAVRSYLMPPLDRPHLPEEHLYNEAQIRTRNPVERLFGCLKKRFPVLAMGLRLKMENIFPVIVATAVLHNILRRAGERTPPDDPLLPLPWENLLQEGEMNERTASTQRNDSERIRIISYFRRLLHSQY